jgi:threonine/homoserine/homoserine lactone efflux protein
LEAVYGHYRLAFTTHRIGNDIFSISGIIFEYLSELVYIVKPPVGVTAPPSIEAFLVATLALNLSPGPDMALVAARSARGGRLVGIASSLGVGAGSVVHIAAAAAGITTVATRPEVYQALRVAGAAVLIWIGIQTILTVTRAEAPSDRITVRAAFRQGLYTNALNPKVAIFFLTFLPQFVDPRGIQPGIQVAMLGGMFILSGTTINIGVACAAARFAGNPRTSLVLTRCSGVVLVTLGLFLAFS